MSKARETMSEWESRSRVRVAEEFAYVQSRPNLLADAVKTGQHIKGAASRLDTAVADLLREITLFQSWVAVGVMMDFNEKEERTAVEAPSIAPADSEPSQPAQPPSEGQKG